MNLNSGRQAVGVAATLLLVVIVSALADPPAASQGAHPDLEKEPKVAAARQRAQLLHDVYSATLEVMHDRYFHDEKAIVPARALEDVFGELSRKQKIKARWISVNTKPMSLNHEPSSEFEKLAAKEIAAGKESVEQLDGAVYQRAAGIELTGGCISCHTGFFAAAPKTPRFAGLVISIPLDEQK